MKHGKAPETVWVIIDANWNVISDVHLSLREARYTGAAWDRDHPELSPYFIHKYRLVAPLPSKRKAKKGGRK